MADGLGGPLLDRTGWTMQQFQEFINRADSDTAYESFIKAKAAKARPGGSGDASSSAMHNSQSMPEEGPSRKRKRDSLSTNDSATTPVDTSGPPSSMRRAYSTSAGGRNAPLRANSPGDPLPGLLPTGAPFRTDRHDLSDVPSSFTSLVDTLNTSAAAPFVSLTSSRSTLRPGPTPPAPGYAPDGGFAMNYGGNTGLSICQMWYFSLITHHLYHYNSRLSCASHRHRSPPCADIRGK
jgi:hypothetical protein